MRYRYLLVDHDDTLMDTFTLRARITAIAAKEVYGVTVDGETFLRDSEGRSLEQMGALLGPESEILRFVDAYRSRYYTRNTEGLRVYDGVAEVIRTLADRGVPMGVVTSKLGSGARTELEATGLAPCLPVVIGAEDVSRPKPDAEPLVRAMALIGADPAETLMVGDTPADVGGARNARTASAAALWGTKSPQALRSAGPDHLLDHPRDLLALFPPG